MGAVAGDADGLVERESELLFDVVTKANELTFEIGVGVGGDLDDVVVARDHTIEETPRASREMAIGFDEQRRQALEPRGRIVG